MSVLKAYLERAAAGIINARSLTPAIAFAPWRCNQQRSAAVEA
jgi:hypothetical protein